MTDTSRRVVRIVLAAGLAAWTLNAVILLGAGTLLGHDEAQYAIAAQDLLDGTPPRWNYLSVGMSYVTVPGVLAGGSALVLRLMPVLLGVAFLLVVARLARGAFGGATAAWSVAVLAASVAFARRAAELLSDLPAAMMLLAGTAILVSELVPADPSSPAAPAAPASPPAPAAPASPPRRRLLLVAPCFAAAFYLRYGSILPIGATGLIALVVGWRAVRQRPGLVLATVALFAVLLVPFLRMSHAATGSALGILEESSGVLGEEVYLGKSLVAYATANPFTYYGVVTTPVLLVGLASIYRAYRARERRVILLWLIAVADIIVIGLTPIAQSRYIFFGLALLVILGVDTLQRLARDRPPHVRRAAGLVAAAAITASWVTVVVFAYRVGTARDRRMEPTLVAIETIRADARGAPCLVFGRHTTQLQWYSGCVAVLQVPADELAHSRVYVVREPGGKYQPELAGKPGIPRTILERPDLVVTRLDPAPAP